MSDRQQETDHTPRKANNPVVVWLQAARIPTLVASLSPVIAALSLAYRDLQVEALHFAIVPAICCVGFALFAQIAANFINDYSDFKKGADTSERKGPLRVVAEGLVSPKQMLVATFIMLGIACAFGLGALPYGGVKLIPVGAVCAVFCLLYSAGPKPLAYIGLGDALVIAFFGVVSVTFTYYLQTGTISQDAVLLGVAMGLVVDNILVANNYRDRDEDRAHGKLTLVAIFGERFGRYFYLFNGLAAAFLVGLLIYRQLFPRFALCAGLCVYLFLHLKTWREMSKIREGKGLVRILGLSARNLLLLAVMLAVGFPV